MRVVSSRLTGRKNCAFHREFTLSSGEKVMGCGLLEGNPDEWIIEHMCDTDDVCAIEMMLHPSRFVDGKRLSEVRLPEHVCPDCGYPCDRLFGVDECRTGICPPCGQRHNIKGSR